MSWINHWPPACWSIFWKSIFKHQLGCRFDKLDSISLFFCILTYAIIYVLIHHIIFGFVFISEIFFIFSSTPVLTSSIDVVFVLSIGQGEYVMEGSYCNIKVHTIAFTISYFCLCSMVVYAIRVFYLCVKYEVKAASMVHESCLTGFISKPLLPQIFIDLSFHIYNTEIAFRIVCNLS